MASMSSHDKSGPFLQPTLVVVSGVHQSTMIYVMDMADRSQRRVLAAQARDASAKGLMFLTCPAPSEEATLGALRRRAAASGSLLRKSDEVSFLRMMYRGASFSANLHESQTEDLIEMFRAELLQSPAHWASSFQY